MCHWCTKLITTRNTLLKPYFPRGNSKLHTHDTYEIKHKTYSNSKTLIHHSNPKFQSFRHTPSPFLFLSLSLYIGLFQISDLIDLEREREREIVRSIYGAEDRLRSSVPVIFMCSHQAPPPYAPPCILLHHLRNFFESAAGEMG